MNNASARNSVSVTLDSANRILVTVGELTESGESYYLGIDPLSPDHNCPPTDDLKRLLQSWIQQLVDADDDRVIYLPFDFSDEYTRWLACRLTHDEITVVAGWARIEGWAISPTDFTELASRLPGFRPDEPLVAQTFYRPWFISQLRRSIAALTPPAEHRE